VRNGAIGMQTNRMARLPDADRFIRRKLESAGVMPTRQRVDLGRTIFGAGDRHFTAEMIYQETRSIRFAPTRGTIYNTLNEFARRGLLREIALYDAKVWYDTKTGPHFHFYFEDTDELSDIPDYELPEIEISPPEGMRVAAIDVIVRLKRA
jgi:Fur family transcriptional regulator, iron response regulator